MARIGTCIICIVLLFSVACPQGITPEPMPSITVHNERGHTMHLDSGAWVLDVPANGSATVYTEADQWAIICVWADGVYCDPLVWSVTDTLELIAHDTTPPTWTIVP